MSRNRGFTEASYASRSDWMTVADAARTLGLRVPQVQGWAQNGHVVSCKHGRRRLVSLGTCRAHLDRARLRERHARAGNPPRIDDRPPQAVTCEIVPVDVAGHQLVGARLDGQEVIAVQYLEGLLGLARGSLAQKMRRRADFVSGVHMFNLTAEQLRAYVSENYKLSFSSHIDNSRRLTVLTAAGVSMALMLGDSDICRRLRQELSTSGFMQSVGEAVISGDGEKFARTLTGDRQAVDLEQFRRDMITETRQIIQDTVRDAVQVAVRESMQAVVALLPELMTGIQTTSPGRQAGKQHRCNMRGETVARLVRQNVLGVKMTATGVHDLARSIEQKRLGLRNDGSGLEGYSELRNAGGAYDVWFYSPAMVKLICDIMRNGQIYMGFVQ